MAYSRYGQLDIQSKDNLHTYGRLTELALRIANTFDFIAL